MIITVQAVFTNGVLRPTQPLSLAEGERVDVTISLASGVTPSAPGSEAEVIQRIRTCQTYREWLEITKLLPADDDGYDIVKALEENRRWSGERALLPNEDSKP